MDNNFQYIASNFRNFMHSFWFFYICQKKKINGKKRIGKVEKEIEKKLEEKTKELPVQIQEQEFEFCR